jgi:hypothetical protein
MPPSTKRALTMMEVARELVLMVPPGRGLPECRIAFAVAKAWDLTVKILLPAMSVRQYRILLSPDGKRKSTDYADYADSSAGIQAVGARRHLAPPERRSLSADSLLSVESV